MNEIQQPGQAIRKIARTCLLGSTALLAGVTPAWAAVSLGAASQFSVLGSTDLTCTAGSVVTGDMGVYPGGFTNTGCTMAGASPPATNAAAAQAEIDLVGAYNSLQAKTCTQTITVAAFTGNVPPLGPLAPGVYCFPAGVTFTDTTLTLNGPSNGIWIIKVGAALTGTNFTVVMTGGGKPCNVYWPTGAGVTMTTSALKGNIVAGNTTGGSITLTGGSLAGRALAKVAVTITGSSVVGCDTLSGGDCSEVDSSR